MEVDFDPSQFLAVDMSEDQNAVYTAPDIAEPIDCSEPDTITMEGGLQMEQNVQIPVPVFDTLNFSNEEENSLDYETDTLTSEPTVEINEPISLCDLSNPEVSALSQTSPNERTSSPHIKRVIATTTEESRFRKDFYCGNYERVKLFRLHCTICDKHLGCAPHLTERQMRMHKLFNVAVCRKCFDFYGDINFPIEDNSEIYCCWCGEGGEVFCCSSCPKIVCKKCVIRNFGRNKVNQIEENDNWQCFVCDPIDIWPHRALFWGLQRFAKELRQCVSSLTKEERVGPLSKDSSHCCLKLNEKVSSISLPRKTIMSKVPLCLIAVAHQIAVRNQPDQQVSQNCFIGATSRAISSNNAARPLTPVYIRPQQSNLQLKEPTPSQNHRPAPSGPVYLQNRLMQKVICVQAPRPSFRQNLVHSINRPSPYPVNRQISPVPPLRYVSRYPQSGKIVNNSQTSRMVAASTQPLLLNEVIDLVNGEESPAKSSKSQPQPQTHDISWLEKGTKDVREALSPILMMLDHFALSSDCLKQDFTKLTNYSDRLAHNIKIAICSLAKINSDIVEATKEAIDTKYTKVVRDIEATGYSPKKAAPIDIQLTKTNLTATTNKVPEKTTENKIAEVQRTTAPSSSSGEEMRYFNPALLCETVMQAEGKVKFAVSSDDSLSNLTG